VYGWSTIVYVKVYKACWSHLRYISRWEIARLSSNIHSIHLIVTQCILFDTFYHMITSNSISKWYIAMNSASINDTFQQQVYNRYVSSFNLISVLEILIYILYSILYNPWLIYHYIYEGIRSLLFSFTLHFNHQNHSYELYNALIHLITIYICYLYTILSYESLWTSIKTN